MPDRRALLATAAGAAGVALTGCLGFPPAGSTPTPEPCSGESPPPAPPESADPKPYPDRPEPLTADSAETFAADYERAYRYNDALAANPDLIGRTNEVTVEIDSATADRRDGGFAVEVAGVLESDFLDPTPRSETPATATRTPLPAGHGPFETDYVLTTGRVEREGVVVECW